MATDYQLASHIDRKHSEQVDDAAGLHWHLLMPWDHDVATDQDEPARGPSPLGLWGAEGHTLPQSDAIDTDTLASPLTAFYVAAELPNASLRNANAVSFRNGFLQTYAGVPLCALVGISLR